MGRHIDKLVQLELHSGNDDLDYTIPTILDDLEEALIENFDKSIKSLVKTLNSLHPLHRLYLADQLVSRLFTGSEFEYYCHKIELELQAVKEAALKSLEKEGLNFLQIELLLEKVTHSVWQSLLTNSDRLKIIWQGTATELAMLILDLTDSGKINLQQISRSRVCALFTSIFNNKDGKPLKPDTLDDYIVQFQNGDKKEKDKKYPGLDIP